MAYNLLSKLEKLVTNDAVKSIAKSGLTPDNHEKVLTLGAIKTAIGMKEHRKTKRQ